MVDLEISACSIIYNAFIFLFEIKNSRITLINRYIDINVNNLILSLYLINNNHFMVNYEKIHKISSNNNNLLNLDIFPKKII